MWNRMTIHAYSSVMQHVRVTYSSVTIIRGRIEVFDTKSVVSVQLFWRFVVEVLVIAFVNPLFASKQKKKQRDHYFVFT